MKSGDRRVDWGSHGIIPEPCVDGGWIWEYGLIVQCVDRVTVDPAQCGGRPCIRGMRIRVKDVLEMLADGASQEEILKDFPDLEAEDIRAAIAYAARYTDHPVLTAA